MAGNKKNQPPFFARQKAFIDALRSGQFTQFYFLYGSQSYLRRQDRTDTVYALLGNPMPASGAALPKGAWDEIRANMNFAEFRGSAFTARQVKEIAESVPFFAERRVILIEDTALFARGMSEEADELADYLPNAPETTCFVFSEEKIDKTRRLYKAAVKQKEKATVLECDGLSRDELTLWTKTLFRRAGKTIGSGVLSRFLNNCGTDMWNILSEEEKLVSYVGDAKEITAADVAAVASPVVEDRIFDMIGAIGAKRRGAAMAIYMDLRKLQTAAQVILVNCESGYEKMLKICELRRRGLTDIEISKAAGVPDWTLSKRYYPALQNYGSPEELVRAYDACVRAENDLRNGILPEQIAAEMLIASV